MATSQREQVIYDRDYVQHHGFFFCVNIQKNAGIFQKELTLKILICNNPQDSCFTLNQMLRILPVYDILGTFL